MAYFPRNVMPKAIRKETSSEVDGFPLMYNARDYNVHHREIIAIERFLIGDGDGGIVSLVTDASKQLDSIMNGGLLVQLTGTIPSATRIELPDSVLHGTFTTGLAPSGSSVIFDTTGWPLRGVLTKLNKNIAVETCLTDGDTSPPCVGINNVLFADYEDQLPHITNQEYIEYSIDSANTLTLIARGLYGSTAQDIPVDEEAMLICGRASVMYSHNVWSADGVVRQVYLEHDANLKPTLKVAEVGTTTDLPGISGGIMEVSYIITVAGNFETLSAQSLASPLS